MTKAEEIHIAVGLEMKLAGIEDIPENRVLYLIRIRNRWLAEGYRSTGSIYIGTINMEILNLQIKIEDLANL